MKQITIKELKEIISKEDKIMVQFKTPWCGVCKMNQPIVDKLIEEDKFKTKWYFVDADAEEAWEEDGNAEFALKLVPTFMYFKKGKKEWEANNFQSQEVLEKVMA